VFHYQLSGCHSLSNKLFPVGSNDDGWITRLIIEYLYNHQKSSIFFLLLISLVDKQKSVNVDSVSFRLHLLILCSLFRMIYIYIGKKWKYTTVAMSFHLQIVHWSAWVLEFNLSSLEEMLWKISIHKGAISFLHQPLKGCKIIRINICITPYPNQIVFT